MALLAILRRVQCLQFRRLIVGAGAGFGRLGGREIVDFPETKARIGLDQFLAAFPLKCLGV